MWPGGVHRRRAAIGSPAEVEDLDPELPEVLGQPFGRGQDLRSGQATHRRYHTGVVAPFMPDPEKLTAVREALPALSAGIYLNTGSVGPMPAETAAAMADIANYERDLGRAHPDYFLESMARMDEARAGVAAVLGSDVGAVALTHSTTDAMNAATLLPDWRAGGRVVTTAHEHAGGVGPLYALRDRNGVELAFVDAGDDGDDDRTLAAFDAAITPGTRLVSISHVLWTTGAVMPVARIAELAHDRGAIVRGRRGAGRRRHPVPFRRPRGGPVRRLRPEVAARSGGDGRARRRPRNDRTVHARPRRPFQLRAHRQRRRRRVVDRWPPLRVERLPPPVGRRDGPLDRLAVDVRRARLRPPAGDGAGRAGGRPPRRRSRA